MEMSEIYDGSQWGSWYILPVTMIFKPWDYDNWKTKI